MASVRGVSRRRGYIVTTKCDETQRPAPDLVNRAFGAEGPNQLWVAHMTYVPTWAGFIYLAIVLDVLGSAARRLGPHMSLEDQSPGQRPLTGAATEPLMTLCY